MAARRHSILLAATLSFSACAIASAAESVVDAVTAPSDRRKLAFSTPGIVRDVKVKEGDPIKAGEVLAQQDDEIEAAEGDRLKHEADSPARLDYYAADKDLKQKTYDRKAKAGDGGFSESELEEAKADLVKSEKQVDVATLDHQGDIDKAKEQELKVDRMKLKSPIDGFVQDIAVRGGEFAALEPEKYAVMVVKNDPAWVEVKELKSSQVSKLKLGQEMQVQYPGQTDWMSAKIIFISPTTFPGTENQLVRLELPNPKNLATGLSIQVKLPENLVEKEADTAVAKR